MAETVAVADDIWEELLKHVLLIGTVFRQLPQQVAEQWGLPRHRNRAGPLGG